MNIAQTVAELLPEHVTLECESIDRMYLNAYVPQLQSVGGVAGYLHTHKGQRFASTAAVVPMTQAFVKAIDEFAEQQGLDVVAFQKGQRKDEVTQQYLARFQGTQGVLYIGKSAGEGPSDAHRAPANPPHRGHLALDCGLHGDGQPCLLLLRG